MSVDLRWEEWDEPDWHLLAELRDSASMLERLLTGSKTDDLPYLHFIDPRTDTVFYQRHLPQLIEELERLSNYDHEPEAGRHLQAVLDFVRKANDRPNSCICFTGN